MENNNNTFKGFSLFNDIEDAKLRDLNRAITMTNIVEMNFNEKEQKISQKGTALIIGYFNQVNPAHRKEVGKMFERFLQQRGFAIREV